MLDSLWGKREEPAPAAPPVAAESPNP
jgi:hypothetical protein